MPATSEAQRRAMAIAEHHPSELYGRNRGLLEMTQKQLHDFASTKETNLPHYVETKPAKRARAEARATQRDRFHNFYGD